MWLFYRDKKEFKNWNEAFTKNVRQVLIMEDLLENLENTGKPKKTGILNLPTANILHFVVCMSFQPFFCVNVVFVQQGGLNQAYCLVVSFYRGYPPMSSNIHQYVISFNSCLMFHHSWRPDKACMYSHCNLYNYFIPLVRVCNIHVLGSAWCLSAHKSIKSVRMDTVCV